MLKVGLFDDFKGRDTLLISMDEVGVSDFQELLFRLSQIECVSVHSFGEKILDSNCVYMDLKIVEEGGGEIKLKGAGVEWSISWSEVGQVMGLLNALKGVDEGHQYFDPRHGKRQVIFSVGEYN